MSDFGKRGGAGPTAGRKAETIRASVFGVTYSKRVFFGQRTLTILQRDETDAPLVQAWADRAEAEAYVSRINGDDCPVQMILDAQPA